MIKKALLLAGILAVFSTTKAHPATDNDTIEVVYADTTGIDIDSIEASIDHIELDEVTVEASAWVRKADRNYNPQIEMFARFKMKSSFHKTKRII